jgi:hypothetical protein
MVQLLLFFKFSPETSLFRCQFIISEIFVESSFNGTSCAPLVLFLLCKACLRCFRLFPGNRSGIFPELCYLSNKLLLLFRRHFFGQFIGYIDRLKIRCVLNPATTRVLSLMSKSQHKLTDLKKNKSVQEIRFKYKQFRKTIDILNFICSSTLTAS